MGRERLSQSIISNLMADMEAAAGKAPAIVTRSRREHAAEMRRGRDCDRDGGLGVVVGKGAGHFDLKRKVKALAATPIVRRDGDDWAVMMCVDLGYYDASMYEDAHVIAGPGPKLGLKSAFPDVAVWTRDRCVAAITALRD
eukprot:gene40985-19094_t